jgi:hypothetical protein
VTDDDGLGFVFAAGGVDQLGVVVDDLADSDVVEGIGVLARGGDGVVR